MSNPLRKCLSMPHVQAAEGGANDWRCYGNSAEAVNSTTRWVKVWADWNLIQGAFAAPQSAAESWNQLNANPVGALQRLDSIIRSINNDSEALTAANGGNIGIILCLDCLTPPWARQEPGSSNSIPNNVQGDSPWAWFVAHLCARYKQGAPISSPGPSLSGGNNTGNTAGAWISALELCNEPRRYIGDPAFVRCTVAQMFKTGEAMAAFWGAPAALMAPGLTDDDAGDPDFARSVLQQLQGFAPRMYFGWSMHNYKDCETAVLGAPASGTRVANMQNILTAEGWKGGTDRMVWLTEGGARTVPLGMPEAEARDRVYASYAQMQALPDIPLFCNHLIVDPPPSTGTFFTGFKRSDFAPKPLRDTWYAMPAANTALF